MKRRTLWALGLAAPAVVAAALALRPAATDARPAASPAPDSPRLPVKGVVLFSSGMGYFQREGDVEGDARVDLTFPAGDIIGPSNRTCAAHGPRTPGTRGITRAVAASWNAS